MILNCLIDGTMTAFFRIKNELAVTMTAQVNYQKINNYYQYKANRIRPVSPQGGFVLYCSKQGICTANSKYNSPKAVVNL